MQKRENFLPFFLAFFILSLSLLLIGRLGFLNFLFTVGKPFEVVRSHTLGILSLGGLQNKEIRSLKQENERLVKLVSDSEQLKSENKALRDQFEISSPSSTDLLPAKVIGSPGFLPGVSSPEYLVIDKGANDGIRKAQAVVKGPYLLGKVVEVNSESSKIQLLTNSASSFTAKIQGISESSGIVKGKGDAKMVLDNILLTINVKKDQVVLTRGEKEDGYPPDLVVGKVISVEKRSSDLFQKAEVLSSIDFSNLELVFVIR